MADAKLAADCGSGGTRHALLTQQGVQPGDRVLLIAENRPEWAIADLAIMATGAIVVPAYTTHTVNDLRHVLELTEPKMALCRVRY
jgi:long-chain acyl-CoA synthetase